MINTNLFHEADPERCLLVLGLHHLHPLDLGGVPLGPLLAVVHLHLPLPDPDHPVGVLGRLLVPALRLLHCLGLPWFLHHLVHGLRVHHHLVLYHVGAHDWLLFSGSRQLDGLLPEQGYPRQVGGIEEQVRQPGVVVKLGFLAVKGERRGFGL